MDVVVSSLNLFIFGIVSMAIGARSTSWLDRTDAGDMIVDHLSKNEEVKAMDLCPEMMEIPMGSKYLETWIRQPAVLWDLGRRMLMNDDKWSSYVGRDYWKDMRTFAGKFQWRKEERRRKEQKS